ncbi:MAG: hypothetical protein QW806_06400 [Nitrososphaerota archaeon]
MNENVEPYILYVSKNFLDQANKAFKLGFLVRKPLLEILRKMGLKITELERDEAKGVIEQISETKGITISTAQLIKSLALAFFVPTGIFLAAIKKAFFRSACDLDDAVIIEFLAEIPRLLKPSLYYDIWLTIPKTSEGYERTKQIFKEIRNKVGIQPMDKEEWEALQPMIEKLSKSLTVKGLSENLWEKI